MFCVSSRVEVALAGVVVPSTLWASLPCACQRQPIVAVGLPADVWNAERRARSLGLFLACCEEILISHVLGHAVQQAARMACRCDSHWAVPKCPTM